MTLSPTQIRYLLLIRQMSNENAGVKSADIARKLGISRASVHKAISSFEGTDLVGKERYSTVTLTDRGIRAADSMLSIYRKIEGRLEPIMDLGDDINLEICGFVKKYSEEYDV